MQKVHDLHESAKEVLERVVISKLAVMKMEEVAKRANQIAKWARKNAEMNSDSAQAVKDLAKEIIDNSNLNVLSAIDFKEAADKVQEVIN